MCEILYIQTYLGEDSINYVNQQSEQNCRVSVAAIKYANLIRKGLENQGDVSLSCIFVPSLGAYPHSKIKYYKTPKICRHEKGNYISFINFAIIKQISTALQILVYASMWLFKKRFSQNRYIVTSSLQLPFFLWSAYAVDIIGDSVDFLIALEQFDKYEAYIGVSIKNEGGTGLGIIFLNILFLTCLYCSKQLRPELKTICFLMLIGFLFTPMAPIGGLIGRLGLYFSILSIVMYPIIFPQIKNVIYRYSIFLSYSLIVIKGFFDFFYSDVWHDHFFEYQTIFSAPNWM